MGSANASDIKGRGNHSPRRRFAGAVCAASLLLGSAAWAQDEPPAEPGSTSEAEAPPATPPPTWPEPSAPPEPSGPHTANSLQFGLGFRYGVMLNDGELNPWGTGLGLDVGYTLPNAIYLGGSFEYFFGSTTEALGLKATANLWQLSAEGGYDVGLGQNFVIRPKVGFGLAGVKTTFEGCPDNVTCETSNKAKPAIAPGATFMLFTSKISLALDLRYDIVLTDPALRGLVFSVGVGF